MFRLTLLSTPFVLLLCGEMVARLGAPERADDPFVRMDTAKSLFTEIERDGRRHYAVTHPEAYAANNTVFPVDKPDGGLRVFCLGGSASAGWPHPGTESYATYLNQALSAAFPTKKVEVLNVGAHAFAAFRVRHICDDVVRFDPNLLIIWSGNNEFVEARSYFSGTGLIVATRALGRHSRLFEWLGDLVGSWLKPDNTLRGAGKSRSNFFMWSQLEQVALELRADEQQYAEVARHYRFSIEAMVAAAAKRAVPVLLLTVPSNLHDWVPNVSVHAKDANLDAWHAAFTDGFAHLSKDNFGDAALALQRACDADALHAETRLLLGRALEGTGQVDAARLAYREAKDLDHNPFRALTRFNDIVRDVAADSEGVTCLDLEQHFDDLAVDAAPGFDLFLDYVHPTKAGNLAAARRIFEVILNENLLDIAPASREFTVPDSGYADKRNVPLQLHVLALQFIMHQYASFIETGDLLVSLLKQGPANALSDAITDVVQRCQTGLRRYLDQRRRFLLGEDCDPDYEAAHKAFYRKMFKEITSLGKS